MREHTKREPGDLPQNTFTATKGGSHVNQTIPTGVADSDRRNDDCCIASQTFAEDELPPEGKFAQINGFEMYYEVYGEGEPLVMLHYFAGSGAIWKPFVPEFSKHYKLVIPDLRGHGRSSILTGKFTHKQSALDVYALLDQLGIKEFRGIGTSTGGMTLLHMATQQPDRVKAMVVVGATPYWGEPCREIMRAVKWDDVTPAEMEESRKVHRRGDEQIRALVKQFHDFKVFIRRHELHAAVPVHDQSADADHARRSGQVLPS